MTKPGDFFVGVTDLFSVLLPGSVLAYCTWQAAKACGGVPLLGLEQLRGSEAYAAFAVSSYLLGHVVDLAGAAVLDSVYDVLYADYRRSSKGLYAWLKGTPLRLRARFRLWRRFHVDGMERPRGDPSASDPVYAAARSVAGSMPPHDRLYQWCRDWLQLHAPQALAEPDRLQGNSKFFRALVVVTIAAGTLRLAQPCSAAGLETRCSDAAWIAGCVVVAGFAFLRYCDLRWKAVQHVYRLYFIGRSEALVGRPPEGVAEEEG